MDFKEIEKKYRPIPFWSWNEKLSSNETVRQAVIMDEAGLGGYFMHARGGLQTAYMGDEWFRNVSCAIDEANKRGMQAWAYDENGWPSGFGDGYVNSFGIDFQQKYLRMESGEKTNDRTIICKDGYHFYYDVNPFYVDTLNPDATQCFIDKIYAPYYEKYKSSFEGYFTDEPQISRNGIPWSFVLPSEYKREYGEELLEKLIELFRPVGDYTNTRVKFWSLVTKLFSQNFMKKIYDWCESRNLKLTGHLVLEESLMSQITSNGAVMPHYEYFHMPGMDWLGRNIFDCLTPLQVSSVAHQLGKKEVLSESFALCGHGVSFDELKNIAQWQMVRGITKFCPHLEGYSIRGLRKRDYPPAMYYQQPWWKEYKIFVEEISRVGKILSEGEVKFDTLLIHNISSAWAEFDGNNQNEQIDLLSSDILECVRVLEEKHILFDLGDEIIMQRHARVENGRLIVGQQSYSTVILPKNTVLLPSTVMLLNEFEAAGGYITNVSSIAANDICDNKNLSYTKRSYEDFDVHYFVNKSKDTFNAAITKGSKMVDLKTGNILPFYGVYKFLPYEAIMVIDNGESAPSRPFKKPLKTLDISGEWQVKNDTENTFILDKCILYFDGEFVGEVNACDVMQLALEQKRELDIRCEYKFRVKNKCENIKLGMETPEQFLTDVNGNFLPRQTEEYRIDKSIRVFDISGFISEGENTVTISTRYTPSEKLLENLEKSKVFESEKNKLCYDLEIEPMYLFGNFGVGFSGNLLKLDKNANRFVGIFELTDLPKSIETSDITLSGFPFFSGRLVLNKTINISDASYSIKINKKGVNALNFKVNGKSAGSLMYDGEELDVSSYLEKGDNTIEVEIVNNLRNLMGPHHLSIGESYQVSPRLFHKVPCVWNEYNPIQWDENYCCIQTGFEISRE